MSQGWSTDVKKIGTLFDRAVDVDEPLVISDVGHDKWWSKKRLCANSDHYDKNRYDHVEEFLIFVPEFYRSSDQSSSYSNQW